MSSDATAVTANWGRSGFRRRKKGRKGQSDRKIMEEKLIFAVSGFPELYDTTLFVYRDNKKKHDSWRNI